MAGPALGGRRRLPANTGLVNPPPMTETITPGNTLRTQRVLPGASARTEAASGLVNAGVSNVASIDRQGQTNATRAGYTQEFKPRSVSAGPRIAPGADPRLAAAQGNVDRGAGAVAGYDRNGVQQTAMQRAAAAFGNTSAGVRPTITPSTSARSAGVAGQVDAARGAVATADPIARERALRGEYAGALGPQNLAAGPEVAPGTSSREAGIASSVDTLRNRAMNTDPATARMSQFNATLDRLATGPAQGGAGVAAAPSARTTNYQGMTDRLAGQVANANPQADRAAGAAEVRSQLAPSQLAAGRQIAGETTARGNRIAGQVDTARDQVAAEDPTAARNAAVADVRGRLGPDTIKGGGAVAPSASGRLTGAQSAADQLRARLSTVDRTKIAMDQLRAFDMESEQAMQRAQEQALKNAAKGGRLGMGRTEEALLRPLQEMKTSRDAMLARLSAETAAGSIDDMFRSEGVMSQAERDIAAQEAAERGELRGERDYSTDIEARNVNMKRADAERALTLGDQFSSSDSASRRSRLDQLAGLEGQEFAQGSALRGENRGERDRSEALSERNLERARDDSRYAIEGGERIGGQDAGSRSNALSQLAGLAGQSADEDARLRGETRQERDYKTGLEERNLERTRADRLNAEDRGASYAGADTADVRSLMSQLSGQEAQEFGQQSSRRGEQRTERDYSTAIAEGNLGRQRDDARTALGLASSGADRSVANDYSRAGLLAGEEQRLYGNEASERGELRGERDYETGLEERNIGRRMDVAGRQLDYGSQEAGAGMEDALSRLSAARGVAGDIEASGRADRSELRTERTDERGVDEANLGREIDAQRYADQAASRDTSAGIDDEFRRAGLFRDIEADSYGRDLSEREEVRGERTYEDYLANDAQSDAERKRVMEEDFFDRDFNRAERQARLGYENDPTNAYLGAADQYGREAEGAFSDVGDLMQAGMYRDAMSEQSQAMRSQVPQGQTLPSGGNIADAGGFPWDSIMGMLPQLMEGGGYDDPSAGMTTPVYNPQVSPVSRPSRFRDLFA